ncbi:MAG: GTP cyclohydrolase I FolE [Saprospiraceae bacterium]
MKLNGTSLNTQHKAFSNSDELGDNHVATSLETPMREDAFDLTNEEKINQIEKHFHEIMQIMGLNMEDESLSGTPRRVAKMYINELFSGLDPEHKPPATLFTNHYDYSQMLVEKNITFYSTCEHHFVPIFGKAHVAYISSGKVIGLSKLNRIVQYYSRRPQVQERLTEQIAAELKEVLNTEDVAVIMDATHMCVASRGVRDTHSSTVTASYYGKFKDPKVREELLHYIK